MRGLDWTHEPYSRLHRRDTAPWMILGWDAQNLWIQLLRKVDRSGVLMLEPDVFPHESIAAMFPGAPIKEIESSVDILIKRGWLVHDEDLHRLLDPEFIDRDEAAMSDRQRKRDSREKRRDQSRNVTHSVTKRDETVTPSHAESRRVTPSEPSEPSEPSSPEPDCAPPSPSCGATHEDIFLNWTSHMAARPDDFHEAKALWVRLVPPPKCDVTTWLIRLKQTDVDKYRELTSAVEIVAGRLWRPVAKPKKRKAKPKGYDTEFAKWWPHHGRKIRKPAAHKAWLEIPKADRPDADEIIAALEIAKRSRDWTKEGGKYMPGGLTLVESIDQLLDDAIAYRKSREAVIPESAYLEIDQAPPQRYEYDVLGKRINAEASE